jgi:signal recognition particle subunit SEC65
MRSQREKSEFQRIVSRKHKAIYHPHAQTIRDIVYWLKIWQSEAQDIRSEGKCPLCGQNKLCSYVTVDTYQPRNDGEEYCGYYCGWCGWGNAGRRYIIDPIARKVVYPK